MHAKQCTGFHETQWALRRRSPALLKGQINLRNQPAPMIDAKLRELVQHCAVHSAYGNYGYEQMNAEQKCLFARASMCLAWAPIFIRHSLATHLLRAGASLTDIGQVLRHQTQDATRIDAKVDITGLRTIGLRWPGGVR
jgi:site-specific recombinase XerC